MTIEDKGAISALAEKLDMATYTDTSRGIPGVAALAHVTCYRKGKKAASFTVLAGFIVDDEGHWFDCSHVRLDHLFRLTSEVWPYVVRRGCATAMWRQSGCLRRLSDASGEHPPEKWCDAVVGTYVDLGLDPKSVSVAENFLCPGAGEGPCHLAMNPTCTPESPPDCVLLFEAEAGWNRHGGPELFSFEHHKPRGGHVLLNDRTIKFVRTEEELRELRWK